MIDAAPCNPEVQQVRARAKRLEVEKRGLDQNHHIFQNIGEVKREQDGISLIQLIARLSLWRCKHSCGATFL